MFPRNAWEKKSVWAGGWVIALQLDFALVFFHRFDWNSKQPFQRKIGQGPLLCRVANYSNFRQCLNINLINEFERRIRNLFWSDLLFKIDLTYLANLEKNQLWGKNYYSGNQITGQLNLEHAVQFELFWKYKFLNPFLKTNISHNYSKSCFANFGQDLASGEI